MDTGQSEVATAESTESTLKSATNKKQVHYYMLPAIFVTMFCFWPTGLMAIMKVTDIDDARRRGDALYLQRSKRAARKWIGVSVLVGLAVLSSLCSVIGWQIFS